MPKLRLERAMVLDWMVLAFVVSTEALLEVTRLRSQLVEL